MTRVDVLYQCLKDMLDPEEYEVTVDPPEWDRRNVTVKQKGGKDPKELTFEFDGENQRHVNLIGMEFFDYGSGCSPVYM